MGYTRGHGKIRTARLSFKLPNGGSRDALTGLPMPIFQMTDDAILDVSETKFAAEGVLERSKLQRLLRARIDVISEDTLVIAEEFGDWEDSKRRIDLLGVDRDANLVVIELKRTESGGHMELQALRYAAMVSTMTFDKALEVYADYLKVRKSGLDARASLLEFLDWEEPNDEAFNTDVRIVLASAEFSKELTTAVLWLNERELDVRCVRVKPYTHNGSLLLDVQRIIPLPEAAAYITGVREKSRKERVARESSKDFTKFDVSINGTTTEQLAKRHAILRVVKHLCASGVTPEEVADALPWRSIKRLFLSAEGEVDIASVLRESFDVDRYFCKPDDLIHTSGKTYAFTKQWGTRTEEAIATLLKAFPNKGIVCAPSNTQ